MNIYYKRIITVVVFLVISISFSACGGGGGSSSFEGGQTIIQIDVNCTTPATINTYIPLQSGDTIVKNDDNSSIEIYHDVDGIKKVCIVSGSAQIVR